MHADCRYAGIIYMYRFIPWNNDNNNMKCNVLDEWTMIGLHTLNGALFSAACGMSHILWFKFLKFGVSSQFLWRNLHTLLVVPENGIPLP